MKKTEKPTYSSTIQFLAKHKYAFLFALILLFALFLRFYNFDIRWGIGNDDARDVAIAQEAIRRGEVPLIGSFSSAGPFVFGPFFYWFIIGSYLLVPFVFTIPWILTALTSVATVALFMLCGRKIAGNNFSLLLGILAATSPQLVSRSLVLGQHTFISFTAVCMLLCFLYFFEKKRVLYALLAGFFVGAAINFHWQALNLLVFLPLLVFVQGKTIQFKMIVCFVAGVGVLIGLSPLLVWDAPQQFANIRNLFDYLLVGQHRLYVPNSWKLFLFTYLPQYWVYVIGGYPVLAFVSMLLTGVMIGMTLVKKKLPYVLFLLLFPFTLLLIVNRYYKGERSEGYLLYFLPFILLFVSYALFVLIKSDFITKRFRLVTKGIGAIIVVMFVSANVLFLSTTSFIYPSRVPLIEKFIDKLVEKYPGQKFSVYDYQSESFFSYYNQPLSLFLSQRGLISNDGIPVGICSPKCQGKYSKIVTIDGLFLVDLQKEKNYKRRWTNVNPEAMYDDLIGWSKRHELKSQFSFMEYLKAR